MLNADLTHLCRCVHFPCSQRDTYISL